MNQEQLRKAVTEGTQLEYLFDDDLWLPASIAHYQESSSHSPNITIHLLHHPSDHSEYIQLNATDVEHRLRLKGAN